MLADVQDVTDHVRQGPGIAHALIYDGEMSKNAAGRCSELHEDLEAIREGNGLAHAVLYGDDSSQHVMANLNAMSDDLRAIVGDVTPGQGDARRAARRPDRLRGHQERRRQRRAQRGAARARALLDQGRREEALADAMTLGARPRSLPIAPIAAPARRNLPLADDARTVDRAWRPVYAVWEITLACDLACRHCGSRAGHARPDELTTGEALDLVAQMAELGVSEVTLIGGEAYLRDDWLDIVRAIRERGMQCTMTTGGRGLTGELARAAKAAGIQSASVSVDGLPATHDRVRALEGASTRRCAGSGPSARRGSPSRRTRRSTASTSARSPSSSSG